MNLFDAPAVADEPAEPQECLVPSLFTLARRVCARNAKDISSVSFLPYYLVRDVVLKIPTAKKLRELEKNSPQLVGEDQEAWRALLTRDVPSWRTRITEEPPAEKWYHLYRALIKGESKEIESDGSFLKRQIDDIHEERAKHHSIVVNPKDVPKLPRIGGMRAEKPPPREGSRSGGPDPAILSFGRGSRTKLTSGRSVVERARREAREMTAMTKSRLATPTHQLQSAASKVRIPPKSATPIRAQPMSPVSRRELPTSPSRSDQMTQQASKPSPLRGPPDKRPLAAGPRPGQSAPSTLKRKAEPNIFLPPPKRFNQR